MKHKIVTEGRVHRANPSGFVVCFDQAPAEDLLKRVIRERHGCVTVTLEFGLADTQREKREKALAELQGAIWANVPTGSLRHLREDEIAAILNVIEAADGAG